MSVDEAPEVCAGLPVICNADYIIDMGPGSRVRGGGIVAAGTPEAIRACAGSRTGKYL